MPNHGVSIPEDPIYCNCKVKQKAYFLVWLWIATGWDFEISNIFCIGLHEGVNENIYLTVLSFHVTFAFQSESTLYSCLNVKEHLAQNRCDIRSLSDCNGTRTHNHLIRKHTRNLLTEVAERLSCVVSTSLYGAFDCMFLS